MRGKKAQRWRWWVEQATTGQVVAFVFGRRTHVTFRRLLAVLAQAGWTVEQCFTDAWGAYEACLPDSFEWKGCQFKKGQLTLLDVHGIDHDERQWERPDEFRTERFRTWNGSPFNFIPQGGGDYFLNHRCAGEWLTIEALKTCVQLLASAMTYLVPEQDLRIDLTRMPTLPTSGFVMQQVRATGDERRIVAPRAAQATTSGAARCPFPH